MRPVRAILTILVFALATPVLAYDEGHRGEERKAVVRHLFEVTWNRANFDDLEKIWSAETQFHFRGSVSTVTADDLKNIILSWRSAFPDFEFTLHDVLSDGDRVAIRVSYTGTQSGKFEDIEPTGNKVDVTEMMFFRFEGGTIVEAWEDFDEYGMRQQLNPR